jgi:apolipoprotein N-acyltransferase
MARMRALENGRYLIRATNNGISAIINEQGKVTARSDQFVRTTLSGEVQVLIGATPFSLIGSTPVIVICFIILLLLLAAGTMGLHLQHD